MKFKEWVYNSNVKEEAALTKRLLLSRGLTGEEEIEEFLHPLEMKLTSPYDFTDMQKAVDRIVKAIVNREKIVIYGDFDADGVTSTSVLVKTLNHLGANVEYFIPDREKEGHGLDSAALVKIIAAKKPKLVITVDCGISNVKEVAFLKSFGVDTIITDHHEAKDELPQALAIINPKAPGALSENLPARKIKELTYLAGCGVAFKLSQALLEKFDKVEFALKILPLVAVGTVADIVPLLGENRCFVKRGLELILNHQGLRELLASAGYSLERPITSEIVAFGIAPRLNASGRLESVDNAMKLLLSDNPAEIQLAVQALNEFNSVRQTLCSDIFAQADEMWQKEGMKNPAVVLFNPEWHIGIIGIVASKFVEKYHKPAFLMTYSEETQQYRCSARGVKGLNIFDILNESAELFDGFGGHELAGGCSFSKEKASFEQVKSAINKTVKDMLNGQELKPFVEVDLKLTPTDITEQLVRELEVFEPFGAANPNPVFAVENLVIKEKKIMGKDSSHLKLLCDAGGHELTCIWWQKGDLPLNTGDVLDILFHPAINEFNGNTYLQLIIQDAHSNAIEYEKDTAATQELKIFDHRKKTNILPMVDDYVKTSKHNIRLFAESKAVIDALKPYKSLSERIFNRNTPEPCDAIMFFDYPADRHALCDILEKTSAASIHLMGYDVKHFSAEEFVMTAFKMLKYAVNYNHGVVELYKFASFLGKSDEVVELLFSLFEEAGVIKIQSRSGHAITITLDETVNPAGILHLRAYAALEQAACDCEEFQTFLLSEDIDKVQELFVV